MENYSNLDKAQQSATTYPGEVLIPRPSGGGRPVEGSEPRG